ncbi:MAG: GNAT family N-acetyltransferase [Pyrinomonadaceae bacterium]
MANIVIRECKTPEELSECVRLQKEVFKLPDIEISPARHLIVSRNAGGFTLGAYSGARLVGFVLSIVGYKNSTPFFYSHMTAIDPEFQNMGIGATLKWAQRERAIESNVEFIKWTFEPVKARNAFFNLIKLGADVEEYAPNYYGTDYSAEKADAVGIASDRLFAYWHLHDERVEKLSRGEASPIVGEPALEIKTINNWNEIVKSDPIGANQIQEKIREEFEDAFSKNLVCKGFVRDAENPRYLLYSR